MLSRYLLIRVSRLAKPITLGVGLTDSFPDCRKASAERMRVPRQHRLDPVPDDLGQVSVVDAGGSEVGDVAVAALVGADV